MLAAGRFARPVELANFGASAATLERAKRRKVNNEQIQRNTPPAASGQRRVASNCVLSLCAHANTSRAELADGVWRQQLRSPVAAAFARRLSQIWRQIRVRKRERERGKKVHAKLSQIVAVSTLKWVDFGSPVVRAARERASQMSLQTQLGRATFMASRRD